MDLDDEELKATRRMNGSDKNVGSMKEDIKLVGNLIKEYRLYGDLDGIAINDMSVYINALEHLIKAYKELEEDNEFLKLKEKNRVLGRYGEIEVHELINKTLANDYIPISLVEEKIEELKSKSGGNVFHIQQTINAEIRLLQELLEKRK